MQDPSLPLDQRAARWVNRHATTLLRVSLAAVFGWFGLLKLLDLSPAAHLVERTVFWFDASWFVPLLGAWELAIGIGLLVRPLVPAALGLLFLQMPGTFLPLVLLPDVCFTQFPYGLTMEGQYIVKNLTLISAAIVVAAAARTRAGHALNSTSVPPAVSKPWKRRVRSGPLPALPFRTGHA